MESWRCGYVSARPRGAVRDHASWRRVRQPAVRGGDRRRDRRAAAGGGRPRARRRLRCRRAAGADQGAPRRAHGGDRAGAGVGRGGARARRRRPRGRASTRSRSSSAATTSCAASRPRTRSGAGTTRWPRSPRSLGRGGLGLVAEGFWQRPPSAGYLERLGGASPEDLPSGAGRAGGGRASGGLGGARQQSSPPTPTGRPTRRRCSPTARRSSRADEDPDLRAWVDAARARWEGEGGQGHDGVRAAHPAAGLSRASRSLTIRAVAPQIRWSPTW